MTIETQQEPDGKPHLILHKVRGEWAFDVATKLSVGSDVWWIIPTSGHRAYPIRWWELDALIPIYLAVPKEVPRDWPDHYSVNDRAKVMAEQNAAPKTVQRVPKSTIEDLIF